MNQIVLQKLQSTFGEAILESGEFRNELTIVTTPDRLVDVCRFLKTGEFRYELLADLCGLDMYTPVKRFCVVYNLYSFQHRHRLRLKVFVEESNPRLPSVTSVWSTANWHERETYDMFGIIFDGHPDLRRIYMPDDFEHHPLRKDFPLMGIPGSLHLPKK